MTHAEIADLLEQLLEHGDEAIADADAPRCCQVLAAKAREAIAALRAEPVTPRLGTCWTGREPHTRGPECIDWMPIPAPPAEPGATR